jgi:two-component system cell cycle sensor histidine kinase/response regulator CckA
LVGKPFYICYETETCQEMLETYRQRFANRSFKTFIERQLKFRSGKMADLEIACSFIAQDNDEPLLLSIFRDITERKRTEELLNQQAASMEASMDGMAILDERGLYIYVNESHAKIYGYDAKELRGKSWDMLYEQNELDRFQKEIMPMFWEKGRWQGEAIGRRRDGTSFPQEISLSRIANGGLVCVVRDITERKLEEERRLAIDRKLLDAQKLESLGVLAGGIAHDFNNLLTAIMGNAGLALMLEPEKPQVKTHLQNIEKTSTQAADLCKQMLAYSGRGKFVIQHLDLNALVTDMQSFLQVSVNKRTALKFELASTVPAIEADPSQMRQIIMNLVINASESIGEKNGVVIVRSGVTRADRAYLSEMYLAPDLPEGDYVFVEVVDNGCGMSPETRAKIFEPFFTTKFTGRGLGLAAVLGIVRGHRGAIKVYSEPGQGTTFKILFPAIAAPAQVLRRDLETSFLWRGNGKILVVDDESSVRAVAGEMLRSMGFDVLMAADGREGVEMFARDCGEIRAVILDMTMPHMNGEEAFREMRRLRGDVRVVLISGYNEQDATNRFVGKGLAGFLQKPFKLDELRRKLRVVLEEKKIEA